LISTVPFRALLAWGPIPFQESERNYNFSSSGVGIVDWNYSTVQWKDGKIILPAQQEGFGSSGVLWTYDIYFSPHIYSLTLNGIFSQPSGTRVLAFVSFGDDIREYPLNWGSAFAPSIVTTRMRLKIFLATSNPDLSPELQEISLKAELRDLSEYAPRYRDDRRVWDLKTMNVILDRYYKDFKHYPIVNINKSEKENQWDVIKNILDSATFHSMYMKNYKSGFINQPIGVDNDYKYGYLTDSSGNNFLLWTKLEQSDSVHFATSWQEKTFDIECQSPTLCISSIVLHEPEPIIRFFDEVGNLQDSGVQFIKENENEKVYLNLNGFRLWLNAPDIFESVGGIWNNIVNLGSTIHQMPLVKFIRAEGEEKVYLVSKNGTIRHMLSQTMVDAYGKFDEIITVGQEIIRALPQNYLIRTEGGHKVYLLDQKIKRWITSPQILEKLNFDFSDVVEVKSEEINSYAEGNPIF